MTADQPPAYSPIQGFSQQHIGASSSSPITRTVQGAPSRRITPMCAISLFDLDKVRLVNTPKALIPLLRQIIQTTWGAIQKETEQFEFAKGGPCTTSGPQTCANNTSCSNCSRKAAGSSFDSLELKLKGNICSPYGDEKVRARRMMVALFKCMARYGWHLVQSTKIIRLTRDSGTFMFRYSSTTVHSAGSANNIEIKGDGAFYSDMKVPLILNQNVEIFAISFNKSNIIRVIDGPTAVYPFVLQAAQLHWPTGVKSDRDVQGTKEFHLHPTGLTSALHANNGDACRWTMVLIELLSLLQDNLGFKLYTSAMLTIDQDLETWFLRKMDASWS
ncbi:hypothetical protein BGZ81_002565 [Podila clonocystis]|nr:hypothetical protein BGZ81_002565 [Podila clonocystis]